MAKQILTDKNDLKANLTSSVVLMVWAAVLLLIWLLNSLNIFIIKAEVMSTAALSCGIIYCIPFVMIKLFRFNTPHMKYVIISICSIGTGLLYVLLNHHVVLMFFFPLVLSLLYFNKRPVLFASGATIVMMTASHIISSFVKFVVDDPFQGFREVMVYGLLPRLMLFLAFSVLCLMIMHACSDMLEKVFIYSDEIVRNKMGLSSIIKVSQRLFGARTTVEVSAITTSTVYDVIKTIQDDCQPPVSRVSIRTEDGRYHHIDEQMCDGVDIVRNDSIEFTISSKLFSLPIHRQKVWDDVQVHKDGIVMTFYDDDGLLLSYAAVNMQINTSDKLIVSLMEILQNNIKIAINNAKLNSDMFRTQEEIILAFAEISESKSKQTGQHVKRVAEYAKLMGKCVGFDEQRCNEFYLAAMLHDIGKLLIPAEILEKPGRLTKEEFDIVKTHVTIGEQLLRNSPGEVMHLARAIALQHHEKWNGTGYLGLAGEQIHYESRLLAVCDVFDALVSKRSYKEGWLPERAYEEIISQSGIHFDPKAVDVFVGAYNGFLDILYKYPDSDAEFYAS